MCQTTNLSLAGPALQRRLEIPGLPAAPQRSPRPGASEPPRRPLPQYIRLYGPRGPTGEGTGRRKLSPSLSQAKQGRGRRRPHLPSRPPPRQAPCRPRPRAPARSPALRRAARLTSLRWGTSVPDAADAAATIAPAPQTGAAPPPPSHWASSALCRPHAGLGSVLREPNWCPTGSPFPDSTPPS